MSLVTEPHLLAAIVTSIFYSVALMRIGWGVRAAPAKTNLICMIPSPYLQLLTCRLPGMFRMQVVRERQ